MGYIIALAGKGGTGKTTVAALIVRIIKEKGLGSILAVDADPNSNLSEALGMESKETIGRILDDIATHPQKIPSGMTKDRFIEYQVQSAVAEADGFDVLTMGKPEGPGCYCYVNNVLRNIMAKLIKDYDYIVIDNEAGLEHLSRRTTRTADCLVIISDATVVGIKAAGRIKDLADELDVKIKKRALIINRWDKDIENERIKNLKSDYAGSLPYDNEIERISLDGNSMLDLKNDAPSLTSLSKILEKIFQES
ncbi:MAG: AAA family ATPase [Candidatus Omnitrophica bacterium]|nr:AAA family ATPase [Candidatus Omnitrophota bacterium]